MIFYEDNYTAEQKALAKEIIDMEKEALEKFYRGDTSGYQKIWSKDNFTYFDANTFERIDTYARVYDFLMTYVEGKVKAKSYEFVTPRVQFGEGTAILTYQLHTILESFHNFSETHYNVIEVYHLKDDRTWEVVHSTWSPIRPFVKDSDQVII